MKIELCSKGPEDELAIELNAMAEQVTLTDEEIVASSFYKTFHTATHFSLKGTNGFTSEAIILLSKILSLLPNLISLDLGSCELGKLAMPIAANLLQSKTLQKLDLSNNNLESHVMSVSNYLYQSETLLELNLSANKLGKYGMSAAENLCMSKTLQKLDLSNNDLGKYITRISGHLWQTISLLELDLSSNDIGVYGSLVAQHLVKSDKLQKLNLSSCKLEAHGEKTVEHLSKSKTIVSVNLAGNTVPQNQVETISEIVGSHNALREHDPAIEALTQIGYGVLADLIGNISSATERYSNVFANEIKVYYDKDFAA